MTPVITQESAPLPRRLSRRVEESRKDDLGRSPVSSVLGVYLAKQEVGAKSVKMVCQNG